MNKNCGTYFSFFSKNEKLSQYRKNSFAIFPIVGLRIENVQHFQCCNPMIFTLHSIVKIVGTKIEKIYFFYLLSKSFYLCLLKANINKN